MSQTTQEAAAELFLARCVVEGLECEDRDRVSEIIRGLTENAGRPFMTVDDVREAFRQWRHEKQLEN